MGTTPAPPPPPPPSTSRSCRCPVPVDTIGSKYLDDINRDSPLAPLFFGLDSSRSTPMPGTVLQANADLRKKPTWQVTVEGHCDERGTAEYNLALGERRAVAAKLSGVARHRRRPDADRELRQGISVRSRPHRGGVGEEPPRALRHDGKVAPTRPDRSCMRR